MLQYKIIRTKYGFLDYAKTETIEERLNEAVKEGWRVEKLSSAAIGSIAKDDVVETYLLSRTILTDEEQAEMVETFRKLNDNIKPAYQSAQESQVEWIVLPDDANVQRWTEVYNKLGQTPR